MQLDGDPFPLLAGIINGSEPRVLLSSRDLMAVYEREEDVRALLVPRRFDLDPGARGAGTIVTDGSTEFTVNGEVVDKKQFDDALKKAVQAKGGKVVVSIDSDGAGYHYGQHEDRWFSKHHISSLWSEVLRPLHTS